MTESDKEKIEQMNAKDMINSYAIPNILSIEETEHGLTRLVVTSRACTAEIYLQGAHLTQWQPTGHHPVLFVSEVSSYLPGKAIRGGIPIIFPWFGARTATAFSARTDGPSHGFARTANWQLVSANSDGDDVRLELILGPDETSRLLGFDDFRLIYNLRLGSQLQLQLTVKNGMTGPMRFEEALHSYFMIGDARQTTISGLGNTEYFDKTDGFKRKRQDESIFHLAGETDRPYVDTEACIDIEDPVLKRRLSIDKKYSKTTVVWNPGSEGCAKLADMTADGWQKMVCVETANALENAVTLAPGEQHTMHAHITVTEHTLDK